MKAQLKESYTLDYIANEELGREKLPFDAGETIQNLPWLNFKKFARYNFRDTLLLMLLEKKNLDLDLLQRLSQITNTRIEKVLSKTISLKNYVNKFAVDNGYVMGNNLNARYGSDELSEFFKSNYMNLVSIAESDPEYVQLFNKIDNFGAYVGDPLLNNPKGQQLITNKQSKFVYKNVFDVDFSALYPSIILALNLATTTQKGKFFLKDKILKEHILYNYEMQSAFITSAAQSAKKAENADAPTDLGPILIDSLQSGDVCTIGSQFFKLPSTSDMFEEIMNSKR